MLTQNLRLPPEEELVILNLFARTVAQVCVCTCVHVRDFSSQYWVQETILVYFLVFMMDNLITTGSFKP